MSVCENTEQKTEVKALKNITRRWMMSDHKKTAELRVTRQATKRYAIEMTDMERKLTQLTQRTKQKENTTNEKQKKNITKTSKNTLKNTTN